MRVSWLRRMTVLVLCALSIALAASPAQAATEDPFKGMRTYDEGKYRVGRDFLEGEYVLLSTSDYSGYFSIDRDANGRETIANDLFETNSIVTVYDGEYLELSRCIAIDATDFYSAYSIRTENDGTMLKVGYDILPGEYELVATSDLSGYYCIYNDSRHTDIVDNDLFKNKSWVTVTLGQYLVLSGCRIRGEAKKWK